MGFNTDLVSKIYMGDAGGQAQMIYGPKGVYKYEGEVANLSEEKNYLSAASVGNYALFGGGLDRTQSPSTTFDAYDTQLTKISIGASDMDGGCYGSVSTNKYAVFFEGRIEYFDSSLVKQLGLSSTHVNMEGLASAYIGEYSIFAGYRRYIESVNDSAYSDVIAMDNNLVAQFIASMSEEKSFCAATTIDLAIGKTALFAGGELSFMTDDGKYSDVIEMIDPALTRTSSLRLRFHGSALLATTIGSYALFGGGESTESGHNMEINAFDNNLIRFYPHNLTGEKDYGKAVSIGKYAVFGGGWPIVDIYDENLVKSSFNDYDAGFKIYTNATTLGQYALYAGGGMSSKVVAYYTID